MPQMICGVLANEVDNGHACPACIVQIRETVAETRAEMQEGAGGFFSHARIAVGGSGDNAFEETEHAAYFRHSVKRSDEVNFRSAGVREAHLYAGGDEGFDDRPSAVHRDRSRTSFTSMSFGGRSSCFVEDDARTEDAVRVESLFDPPHEGEFHWVLELTEVLFFLRADAVLG